MQSLLYRGARYRAAVQHTRPTPEMLRHFRDRTDQHIGLVVKYMEMLDGFRDLDQRELTTRAKQHDADKWDMAVPYCWVTEYYRVKNNGQEISDQLQAEYDLTRGATGRHVRQNRHHPEAHANIINMTNLDLAEMVADWSAMAEELGEGSARGWADKNVGTKWKFSPEQKRSIYKAIDRLEVATGDKQVAASVMFQGSRYDLITASVTEKDWCTAYHEGHADHLFLESLDPTQRNAPYLDDADLDQNRDRVFDRLDYYSYGNPYVSAVEVQFYLVGYHGLDVPVPAVGFRYGAPPDTGVSKNYRDDVQELGVSMAWIKGKKKDRSTPGAWGFPMSDRPLYRCKGFWIPGHVGSDGEPMMIVTNATKVKHRV